MVSIITLYYNIIISWDHRHVCGPSLTKMSLCSARLYISGAELIPVLGHPGADSTVGFWPT